MRRLATPTMPVAAVGHQDGGRRRRHRAALSRPVPPACEPAATRLVPSRGPGFGRWPPATSNPRYALSPPRVVVPRLCAIAFEIHPRSKLTCPAHIAAGWVILPGLTEWTSPAATARTSARLHRSSVADDLASHASRTTIARSAASDTATVASFTLHDWIRIHRHHPAPDVSPERPQQCGPRPMRFRDRTWAWIGPLLPGDRRCSPEGSPSSCPRSRSAVGSRSAIRAFTHPASTD